MQSARQDTYSKGEVPSPFMGIGIIALMPFVMMLHVKAQGQALPNGLLDMKH